ncbi:MAG: hypothetical protein L6282_09875 [Candidatus Methanoperedenaceae archaeon]|nr:hypothetical protein [Candidatus Methanoperedenaceae archaeon]
MKELIIREFNKWLKDLFRSIKKDPLQKIILIFISLILIQAMADALLSFGWFTVLGYYVACIYGFSKILDNPYRIIYWGGGYAIGASVTPLIFSSVWPQIKEGTYVSIFSGVVILYVIIMVWLKARELKES